MIVSIVYFWQTYFHVVHLILGSTFTSVSIIQFQESPHPNAERVTPQLRALPGIVKSFIILYHIIFLYNFLTKSIKMV